MTDIVIAGYARSPFTPAKKGALARVRPDDLAAQVVRKLVADIGTVSYTHLTLPTILLV